jgi:hypothetical protein
MIFLLFALKVLHVLAAAVWLGASLTVPADIRHALGLGPPHSRELLTRLRAVGRLMNTSALLTLLTGIALVLAVGGFGSVPHRIHAGLVLTLLAVAAGKWLIRPAIVEIAQASKEPVSSDQLARLMAKFWLGNGIEHALRVVVLVLMVYPFTF